MFETPESLAQAEALLRSEIGRLGALRQALQTTLEHLESVANDEASDRLLPAMASGLEPLYLDYPQHAQSGQPPAVPAELVPAPALVADTDEGAAAYLQFDGYDEEDTPEQLSHDIAQWQPRLDATPLEDVYLAACRCRPVHFAPVPADFDINDEECRRVVSNYLRHRRLHGYRSLCARLKRFQGLGYLYKRLRDKATGIIVATYPELAGPSHRDEEQPSGATHFAELLALKTNG